MNLKKAYYYVFYKLYKFGELSPSSFPSDFTANFAITVFEVLFLIVLKFYYIEFVNRNDTFVLASYETIIPLVIIFLINYFAFINDDRWKKYVKEFDKWPKKKNRIGTLIVVGIGVFIIVNLCIAVHVMAQITGIH